MGELAYSVWINAAPEQVWRTYVDPSLSHSGVADGQSSHRGGARRPRRSRFHVRFATQPSDRAYDGAGVRHSIQSGNRTDAYFGLWFELTSRLTKRVGGTDLELTVETHWRPGRRLLAKSVERAILSRSEARKELTNLKTLIERETVE